MKKFKLPVNQFYIDPNKECNRELFKKIHEIKENIDMTV